MSKGQGCLGDSTFKKYKKQLVTPKFVVLCLLLLLISTFFLFFNAGDNPNPPLIGVEGLESSEGKNLSNNVSESDSADPRDTSVSSSDNQSIQDPYLGLFGNTPVEFSRNLRPYLITFKAILFLVGFLIIFSIFNKFYRLRKEILSSGGKDELKQIYNLNRFALLPVVIFIFLSSAKFYRYSKFYRNLGPVIAFWGCIIIPCIIMCLYFMMPSVKAKRDKLFRFLTTVSWSALFLTPFLIQRIEKTKGKDVGYTEAVRMANSRFWNYIPYLLLVALCLLVLTVETRFDIVLTHDILNLDFTPLIYSIEGDIVERFQLFFWNDYAKWYFILIYTYTWGFLFYFFVIYFTIWVNDSEMVKKFINLYAYMYLIALPFFLFFPVNEAWTTNVIYEPYNYGNIVGVLHNSLPGSEAYLYTICSINNCFPSLHTSFASGIFFLLLINKFHLKKVIVPIVGVISISIVISTMYLGVHWLSDVVAGVIMAIVVTYLAQHTVLELGPAITIKEIWWKDRRLYPRKGKGS